MTTQSNTSDPSMNFSWEYVKVDGRGAFEDIRKNKSPEHLLSKLNHDIKKDTKPKSKTDKVTLGSDKSGPVIEISINTKDRYGQSLLDSAIRLNQVDVVGAIVNAGAAVTYADTHGVTPLHEASHKGQMEAVAAIVKRGGNSVVDAKDEAGNTPLHLALIYNHPAIAKFLIRHGADVDLANNEGITPKMLVEKLKLVDILNG